MKAAVDLAPLGSARPPVSDPLLAWLRPVQETLGSEFAIEPEVALLAWELARWPAGLDLEERKALVLLALGALVALRQGSTRLPLRGEESRLRLDLTQRLFGAAGETLQYAADSLIESGRAGLVVGSAGEFKPLVVVGEHLYLQKMRVLEERFAASVRGRLRDEKPRCDEAAVEEALGHVDKRPAAAGGVSVTLSSDQADAVRAALRFRLSVISGGPGTGKTTVVVSILRVLARLGIQADQIALAAPTGKAANRLHRAIQDGLDGIADPSAEDDALRQHAEPCTLHRLLGATKSGRFTYHENNRLAQRVVVVDEASMIDLVLMERLVRSLRDDARLVLLGDEHQLPSVEAGAVLRDLLAPESPLGARTVRLTESYRMRADNPDGRNILTVSRAINSGTRSVVAPERTGDDVVVQRPTAADATFRGVELVATPEGSSALEAFLDRWYTEVIRGLPNFDARIQRVYRTDRDGFGSVERAALQTLFEHFDRARILCLTRVRPTGSDRINALLHRRALRARGAGHTEHLFPGDPVMMEVNDPVRKLYNGDQGLVLNVSSGGRSALPMAVFPRDGGFEAFRLDALRSDLVRSYALTVHKAQGSEYEQIALVLPDADLPINAREVLYTALTRAKKAVTILGTQDIFNRGIERRIHRSSGLLELLHAGASAQR
jgi:exodeoxyribonuclease V alpha subunit